MALQAASEPKDISVGLELRTVEAVQVEAADDGLCRASQAASEPKDITVGFELLTVGAV